MDKNELILKAHELDAKPDCDGVVDLLKDYVNEFSDDLDFRALYQKNIATKESIDLNLDSEKLYAFDVSVFDGMPDDKALKFIEKFFAGLVADAYLSNRPEKDKEHIAIKLLEQLVAVLSERFNELENFKTQIDKFYECVCFYGYNEMFYEDLAYLIDWRSKASANILIYLKETAEATIVIKGYEDIYNDYIKDKTGNVFPYSEKPVFNMFMDNIYKFATNVKTQEQKDFWTDCYAFQKKVREEEYIEYKKIVEDKKHKLHGIYLISKYIHDSKMHALMKKSVTSSQVAEIMVYNNCTMIKEASESKYKTNIQDAENLYNAVKNTSLKLVSILDTIKGFLKKD